MKTAMALAWLAFLPISAHAQMVEVAGHVEQYAAADPESVRLESVRLSSLRVTAAASLASWAVLEARTGLADAVVTLPNGEAGRIRGLEDARVVLSVFRRSLRVSGLALLPTGRVPRSVEEASVAGIVWSDALPFGPVNWGMGGGIGAGIGYGLAWGRTSLNLSAELWKLGESSPLGARTLAYEPGPRLTARAMLETTVGSAGLLSLMLGYQPPWSDRYDASVELRGGRRLEATASLALPLGSRESLLAYAGIYVRRAAAEFTTTRTFFGEVVSGPQAMADVPRDLAVAGVEARWSRGRIAIFPSGEVQVTRSSAGVDQSWLGAVGIRTPVRVVGGALGRRMILEPALSLKRGRLLQHEGAESMFLGWSAGVTARWLGR